MCIRVDIMQSLSNNDGALPQTLPASFRADVVSYVYQPIATITKDIRLIELLSSEKSWTWSDSATPEIVLRIHHRDLSSSLEEQSEDEWKDFAALSYVWGHKDAPLRRVYVAGPPHDHSIWRYIEIRENLFQFLWYFRDTDANRSGKYLWVDQLCINQPDLNERNHQVNLMAQIYENASFVITWLGNSPDVVQAAETLLSLKQYNNTSQEMISLAFIVLLNNQYFTRLWIVQEVLLAKEVRVFCGIHWLDLLDLRDAYRRDIASSIRNSAPYLIWDVSRTANTGVPGPTGIGPKRSLAKCIERYTSNRCEDPRDRIYGLLGLADETDRIDVDYAKPVWKVYYDGVKILYKDYYMRVNYFATKHEPAGYVETALKLGADMGMPRFLWDMLCQIPPTGDWIHRLVPLLDVWE